MSTHNSKLTDFWSRPAPKETSFASKTSSRPVHLTVGTTKRRKLWPSHAPYVSTNDDDGDDVIPSSTISLPDSTLTPPISPARRSSPPVAIDAVVGSLDGADDELPGPGTAHHIRHPAPRTSTTSFTSFTSLPSSTQSFTSRRTTTSDGKEAVLDSSSGNDTDSSLDLPQPTSSLSPVKSSASMAKLNKTSSPPAVKTSPARVLRRPLPMASLARKPIGKSKTKAKTSFEALMAQSLLSNEADKRFETAKVALQVVEEQPGPVSIARGITKDTITSLGTDGDDDDDGTTDRVWRAMQRTEAIHQETTWYMFTEGLDPSPRLSFPIDCMPETGPLSGLRIKKGRKQLDEWHKVLRLCGRHRLPEDLINWLTDEVYHEPSENLVHCYIDILSANSKTNAYPLSHVDGLLRRSGVRIDALDLAGEVKATAKPRDSETGASSMHKIPFVVDLLARTSNNRPLEDQLRAIQLLLRMSLDEHVCQDFALSDRIGTAIELITSQLDEEGFTDVVTQLGPSITSSVKSPHLRQRLLNAFVCTSPRSHFLRRQLALRFSLDPADAANLMDPGLAPRVFKPVISSVSRRALDVDYAEVVAQIDCIDIAIDCGFSDMSFALDARHKEMKVETEGFDEGPISTLPRPTLARPPFVVTITDSSPMKAKSAPHSSPTGLTQTSPVTGEHIEDLIPAQTKLETERIGRPSQTTITDEQRLNRAIEKAYNRHIDSLAARTHDIAGRIRITGATNIRGTEARAAAERLALRLEAGLRTRRAGSRDAFAGQQGLAGWLKSEQPLLDDKLESPAETP